MSYEAELRLAKKAASAAGAYLAGQGAAQINSAVGKDVKLLNDIESEKLIIEILGESGIAILSEESGLIGDQANNEGLRWIVDPMDGSANFWKGMRELTCVSIALWDRDTPILGVVNRFQRREVFWGVTGKGAYLNDTSIRVSDIRRVEDAVIATGFPLKMSYDEHSLKEMIRVVQRFKKVRMLGAAALMGSFVAAGRIDAYTENHIMLWDIAAATAIVTAAGGVTHIVNQGEAQCQCELFANQILYDKYVEMKRELLSESMEQYK